MQRWRLLVNGPADGPTNMAIDEALLETASTQGTATLRLYAWQPPCLSLGYFQPLADVDRAACAAAGVTLVRRPTGGRAVLHDADELTYAVVGPLDSPPFDGGVIETYYRIATALATGLAELGLDVQTAGPHPAVRRSGPACFGAAGAHEITVSGKKLVGSAQTRRGRALLQHGAIALVGDPGRVADLLHLAPAQRPVLRARLSARSTTLAAALGRRPERAEVAQAITRGFARILGVEFVIGELTAAEIALVERLRAERYAHPAWLARR